MQLCHELQCFDEAPGLTNPLLTIFISAKISYRLMSSTKLFIRSGKNRKLDKLRNATIRALHLHL
uniref:Uncharacterized protein n=1 Tax=Setaria italica TaxID=4555 RepID=K3XP27_SETIT